MALSFAKNPGFLSFRRAVSAGGTGMIPYFVIPLAVWKVPSLYLRPCNLRFSSATVSSAGTSENSCSIAGWPMTIATPAMLVGSARSEFGFFHHWLSMNRIVMA